MSKSKRLIELRLIYLSTHFSLSFSAPSAVNGFCRESLFAEYHPPILNHSCDFARALDVLQRVAINDQHVSALAGFNGSEFCILAQPPGAVHGGCFHYLQSWNSGISI